MNLEELKKKLKEKIKGKIEIDIYLSNMMLVTIEYERFKFVNFFELNTDDINFMTFKIISTYKDAILKFYFWRK